MSTLAIAAIPLVALVAVVSVLITLHYLRPRISHAEERCDEYRQQVTDRDATIQQQQREIDRLSTELLGFTRPYPAACRCKR